MSPASSGTLEVEKYIGACLFTQQRPKTTPRNDVFYSRIPEVYPGNYYREGWAGGMPLISFAHQKRGKEEQLARFTQGAPLILTKTFNRRRNQKKNYEKKGGKCEQNGVDTVSVTSDESSGSNNSDNCLPRIIKPRKRRKKDRKPPGGRSNVDGFSTDSASPDIDNSILTTYTPFFYPLDSTPKPLEDPPESETPQLHHSFEDVEEIEDVDINGNQTVCQCRYCDPAGQIWDVDRSCYSPFLTPRKPPLQLSNLDTFLGSYSASCLVHSMSLISIDDSKDAKSVPVSSGDLEVSTEIVTSLNGHRDIEIKFFSSSTSVDSSRNVKQTDEGGVNNECNEV